MSRCLTTIGSLFAWQAVALAAAHVVDPSTLNGKVVAGYQGWFTAPGDGNAASIGWFHWSKSRENIGPGLYNVDLWPDLSGFDADELYPAPNVQLTDGSPAALFSSRNAKTVTRHFKWMKDTGIDGVFLQRFVSELSSANLRAHRNAVLENVRAAANTHGRTFAVEYDISGAEESTLLNTIWQDWQYLVNTLHITSDPRYLRHNGKPVVIVWGLGVGDRPGTPAIAAQIIAFFKTCCGGQTVVGGVAREWRTLQGGSKTDPAWANVYRSFDILTPWTVGSYVDTNGINAYKNNVMVPDIAECNALGIGFLPTVWPGFSWDNLMQLPPGTSVFPRRNGNHLWDQVHAAHSAGASMLFVAMFDEVDEGTAIFKVSEAHPVTDHWVTYEGRPPDWYMRLAGAAGQLLSGATPPSATIPISPQCGGDEVSFNLGEDQADRMTHVPVADGDTLITSIGGKSCRRNSAFASDLYFYFAVDDEFAYQANQRQLCITVDYYDTGSGSLSLQYDSDTGDDLAARYQHGGSVNLTNSSQWKRKIFLVADAYFGNRQNNGADFRIARSGSGYFYLDRVRVGSPIPPPPAVQLDPTAFDRVIEAGSRLAEDRFAVTNSGGSPLHYQISSTAGWMRPSQAEGTSTGESDPVQVIYDVAGLEIGDYEGRIDVVGTGPVGGSGSSAIEVHLRVNRPRVPGDFDDDEDVDQDDFGFLQACLSGTAEPIPAVCQPADLDGDGDVDLDDFQRFRTCLGGADLPPGC